jgi:hypothetical protein
MHAIFLIYLFSYLTIPTQAIPNHHHHHKRAALPIAVSSVAFLGDVHSETTYVKRDLGFQGQIGQHVLLSYGDTMFSDANYTDTWRGMTSDSVALATHDPTKVLDVNNIKLNNESYPRQFCPLMPKYDENSATWSCGITNIVETYPGQGVLYYLLNSRPDGVNNLIGAGVAMITMSNAYPPIPSLTRLPGQQYWWDAGCEPWFGDVGSVRAKGLPWVYLTRVPWESATDLSCYQYWNGEDWQGERLYTTNGLGEKEGVFWQIKYVSLLSVERCFDANVNHSQGQVIWSAYYNCYMFVYCDNWMNNKVLAVTADKPEGPWSNPMTLYHATPLTAGSSIYAAVPHPYFDQSGETLVVTFTNHPNCIQAVKVVSRHSPILGQRRTQLLTLARPSHRISAQE